MALEEAIKYLTEYIYCEFECCPGYTDCACCNNDFTNEEIKKVLCLAKEALEQEASIVRCEDCKYCEKSDEWAYWCFGHGIPARLTTSNDFCSKGRRKNNDHINNRHTIRNSRPDPGSDKRSMGNGSIN